MSTFVFAFLILSVSVFSMSVRLVMGPTVPDRVVALDTMNTFVVAMMIILGAVYDSIVMVDIAIVYAALSFVGTLFIARYIEGGF
ncbi:MAG TPA: monovalent cation/H+ antiporter complex subunit F [Acetomicrobium flavidum]|uniref:Multisubunit Na+/H+ antiporter, MnhF subunit n=2 Tax=Acetomicrobium TaxID=49894 RepID=I4BXQ3_ACEMN|nr:monovalent cation/H+ antiporter complex subunit F [Acetomicrobium mobile]NLG94669.1 cation:proton antiporter [Acetomicrobium flavidum]AFM22060.1 multisubunit Na+/H+ antiporter, MnhF subunit [Acetomicrobium mobile DSM 13181]SIN75165.1 Membrane bound hydrogenase subunit mbhB [Acetomicrobium flavidum]HOJ82707.1 monovalent cation/H+ antiporter complex subunit F [Acetomicrobium flavidum]HOM31626.1 monovalent cation/H+ antiporter complex subunit F [Acetomicrobium flavidum]